MTTTPATVNELLDYWPGNIPFKGSLVSEDGSCMCAQGQALHFLDKLSPSDLRLIDQVDADKRVAEIFNISRAHSVLLRIVNDGQDGAPTSVIRNPEQVLGDQAYVVLAFWRRIDQMDDKSWVAAWDAARDAAGVSNEIQGAAVMRTNGQPFFFLPFFGFADPEAVMAADREQSSRAV